MPNPTMSGTNDDIIIEVQRRLGVKDLLRFRCLSKRWRSIIDIIIETLRRLGVKDLLRFRCVSKQWRSLIDDPNFIKLHLSHSLRTNTNLSLIFECNRHFYSVNIDSLRNPQRINHPLNESTAMLNRIFSDIVGSCNGLIALVNGQREISLWNPSTRKSQMLPFSKIKSDSFAGECYGFGYDLISDDYKLVRILQFYVRGDYSFRPEGSEVEIYSLRTNSCRKIKDFPFQLTHIRARGVLANNAAHWLVLRNLESKTQSLVAFDLGSEEFRVVELPDCLDKASKWGFNVGVGAMGGYLCLTATYREVEWVADVWMKKEYGVKESWTKLFSLKFPHPTIDVLPWAFSKNGDRVLLSVRRNTIVWYNMDSKTVENVLIEGVQGMYNLQVLVGSLVPLNGNGAVIEQKVKFLSLKN